MSDMLFVGAGIVSAVNLGLGYFVGQKFAGVRPNQIADQISELSRITSRQLDDHTLRVKSVSSRLSRDTSTLTSVERDIRDAIELLLLANKLLQADLKDTRHKLNALQNRRPREVDQLTPIINRETVTDERVTTHTNTAVADRPSLATASVKNLDVNRRLAQRPYKVQQRIAAYESGELPKQKDFFAVQCWDISSDGFSFLADSPPSFNWLVAALGNPTNRTYFSARVSTIAEFTERGNNEYRVACQFTGRLHHHLFE